MSRRGTRDKHAVGVYSQGGIGFLQITCPRGPRPQLGVPCFPPLPSMTLLRLSQQIFGLARSDAVPRRPHPAGVPPCRAEAHAGPCQCREDGRCRHNRCVLTAPHTGYPEIHLASETGRAQPCDGLWTSPCLPLQHRCLTHALPPARRACGGPEHVPQHWHHGAHRCRQDHHH